MRNATQLFSAARTSDFNTGYGQGPHFLEVEIVLPSVGTPVTGNQAASEHLYQIVHVTPPQSPTLPQWSYTYRVTILPLIVIKVCHACVNMIWSARTLYGRVEFLNIRQRPVMPRSGRYAA